MTSLPHARGGVSQAQQLMTFFRTSSPRPWGCFSSYLEPYKARFVFPTPVGVFPFITWAKQIKLSLPHARGGVSKNVSHEDKSALSSPRPWGCFLRVKLPSITGQVFPTPVGVFLKLSEIDFDCLCLPHARGGVSAISVYKDCYKKSSPRPWGCFQ